jgi:hypothetical protein
MQGINVTARKSLAGCCVLLALLATLQGCSLISLKSPGTPLSQRELNARMMTREYADYFQRSMALAADDIAATSSDPDAQLAALKLKVRAASASRHAAMQMSPMMELLDSWALAAQMKEFLTSGAGSALFGPQQEIARSTAAALEADIVTIAREVAPPADFARYGSFVEDYVHEAPLTGIEMVRISVVDRWMAFSGQKATLISTVGTAPEVVSDLADRMRLYGDQLPSETLWQGQIALREAGYGANDWKVAMNRMNDSLNDVGKLAQTSPELLRTSITDLRGILFGTTDRLDQSWMGMMHAMHAEREALTQSVQQERANLLAAVDVQRAAMSKDAERIATEVTESSWRQLRALVREFALFALAGIIVLFGLPFAAGYYLGRARGAPLRR